MTHRCTSLLLACLISVVLAATTAHARRGLQITPTIDSSIVSLLTGAGTTHLFSVRATVSHNISVTTAAYCVEQRILKPHKGSTVNYSSSTTVSLQLYGTLSVDNTMAGTQGSFYTISETTKVKLSVTGLAAKKIDRLTLVTYDTAAKKLDVIAESHDASCSETECSLEWFVSNNKAEYGDGDYPPFTTSFFTVMAINGGKLYHLFATYTNGAKKEFAFTFSAPQTATF